jgi:hypothetical protein
MLEPGLPGRADRSIVKAASSMLGRCSPLEEEVRGATVKETGESVGGEDLGYQSG